MELRQPPSRFAVTFKVSGGASPRTPESRTRSGPSWATAIVSKRGHGVGAQVAGPADLVEELAP